MSALSASIEATDTPARALSWWGLLAHQLRLDARRARWLLVLALLVVTALAWNVWPAHRFAPGVSSLAQPFAWIILVVVAAQLVLHAAPARPDGWLAGKPAPASVLLASTLLLALGGVLGGATVATLAQLLAIDVPMGDAVRLAAPAAGTMALWFLGALALASFARSLGQLLLTVVLLALAMAVGGLLLPSWWNNLELPGSLWLPLMVTGGALLVVLIWWGYTRRRGRAVGTLLAAVVSSWVLFVATHGPGEGWVWNAYPAIPGMGVSIEELTFVPGARGNAEVAPEQRLSDVLPMGTDLQVDVVDGDGARAPEPHVRLTVRVTGAPAGSRTLLDSVTLALVREDGRAFALWLGEDREVQRAPVAAAAGRQWRGMVPRAFAAARMALHAPDSLKPLLAQHLAGAPGARIVRASFTGRVRVLQQRVMASLPYGTTARARSAGVRITARPARDTLGLRVDVAVRELDVWLDVPGHPASVLRDVMAYALNAEGTEAVRLPVEAKSRDGEIAILPGVNVTHGLLRLRPDKASALSADDPWFTGATLLLLGWKRVGMTVVRAEVAVPVQRGDER
jgi:hypothetical protein